MTKRVFIGSSGESLDVAFAAQEALEPEFECTVWTQGVFGLSGNTLDSLLDRISKSDLGLFIFAPDDVLALRGKQYQAVRDNVLFELGLFMGGLGRHRTFAFVPSDANDLRFPTDLAGFTTARYFSNRSDGNLVAALGPACNAFRKAASELEVVGRPVEVNAVADQSVSDDGDILALLQSWMGNRPADENSKAIRFIETDRELNLVPGSTQRYIERVAERWGYEVAHKGKDTILFQKLRPKVQRESSWINARRGRFDDF